MLQLSPFEFWFLYCLVWGTTIILFVPWIIAYGMAIYYSKKVKAIKQRLSPLVKDKGDNALAFLAIGLIPYGDEISLLAKWGRFLNRKKFSNPEDEALTKVFQKNLSESEKKFIQIFRYLFNITIFGFFLMMFVVGSLKYLKII